MRARSILATAFLALAACATPLISVVEPPVSNALAASAEDPLQAEARSVIQAEVDAGRFSGTVLVARDGAPVFREAFGFANRELDVPMKPDSILRLASITKQFTAAAILKLAEEGKLSLDDPASKFYAASPPAWSRVTIRHLLTHRSGIGDYTSLPDFFTKLAGADRTPEEILALTRDQPLTSEPGARYAYNNSGYVLLGHIIETISGQSYADYMQQHIFTPLGLKDTGYDDTRTILARRAAGYTIKDGQWLNANYLAMSLPHAAGALYSTIDDLLLWEEALFGGRVVSQASLAQMTTDHGGQYGLGLIIDKLGDHRNIWHNGGINGFSTHMNRFVDDGLTVIVLSNVDSGASGRLATSLSRLWLGIPPPAPLVAVEVPTAILDRYVGVYELMPGMNLTLTRQDATLMAQATGQGAFPLTATSETEFHFEPASIRMVFPATEGPAQTFQLEQGAILTAKRLPD